MQDKLYFTMASDVQHPSFLFDALHVVLNAGECSDSPSSLDDGILYQVTIEQVGRIRTTKEVEFDSAQQEESN